MNRQWFVVIGVVAAIGIGATLMVRNAPPRIEVGAVAPDFTVTNLATSKPVSLQHEYRGKVTLVNIWATWCGPCREEIPALDSLYRALAPKGLRIAAVSVDQGAAADVVKFMNEFHVTFDVLHDPKGAIQELYQSPKVPQSYLIGRDGRFVRIVYGSHPWASPGNRKIIEQLLSEPSSGSE
ncbi:MAG: TlpA family protein disulfide reductase [Gemmatimonadetes bacterium]|nr:TlpA family protein disulfide reductase [Gemmatimonadota bacterium]MBL0179897.1 TlpA family protein disulfide reductase [Gemmatimonadota bacterium]